MIPSPVPASGTWLSCASSPPRVRDRPSCRSGLYCSVFDLPIKLLAWWQRWVEFTPKPSVKEPNDTSAHLTSFEVVTQRRRVLRDDSK